MASLFDLETGRDLAERLAVREVQENEDFSTLIIQSAMDGILAYDRSFRYTLWNPAMERISGVSREKVLGRCAFEVFPFLVTHGVDWYFAEALKGRTLTQPELPYIIPETGRQGYYEAVFSPLRDEIGRVVGGLKVVRDTTERHEAQEWIRALNEELEQQVRSRTHELDAALQALQRRERAQHFVAEAGIMLAGSLDYETTLSNVVRLAHEHFTGYVCLRLLDDERQLKTVAVHATPEDREVAIAFFESFQPRPNGECWPNQALKTGVPVWMRRMDDERIRPQSPQNRKMFDTVRPRSYICIPLFVRGKPLGTLSIFSTAREYDEVDLSIAEDLGRRFALAIENARLYAKAKQG